MKYLIDTSKKFTGIVIDRVINGKTAINGHTLEESAEWHNMDPKDLSIIDDEEMKKLVEKDRQSKIEPFTEISQKRFDYMLGVLPPLNFTGSYFQISEALQYDLRATFYQKNGKFYEATLPTGTIKDNREYINDID